MEGLSSITAVTKLVERPVQEAERVACNLVGDSSDTGPLW